MPICLQVLNIACTAYANKDINSCWQCTARLLSLLASGTAVAWRWTLLELKLGLPSSEAFNLLQVNSGWRVSNKSCGTDSHKQRSLLQLYWPRVLARSRRMVPQSTRWRWRWSVWRLLVAW